MFGMFDDVVSPRSIEGRTSPPSVPRICVLEEVPQYGTGV
jgi:hypothetical protein